MITTFRVPFSHDGHDSSAAFDQFVARVRLSQDTNTTLHTVCKPIFSYSRCPPGAWEFLASLVSREPLVVAYLCDIESYATVLVSARKSIDIGEYETFGSYASLSELLSQPRMIGYGLTSEFTSTFRVPSTLTVLGQLPYCALDDALDEPNPEWFDVITKLQTRLGPVYAYRIAVSAKCLDLIAHNDEPSYFLPAMDGLSLADCLSRYHGFEDNLTDYLIRKKVLFGTINDGHQDDSFAVSYFGDIWKLGDVQRVLIS